MKKIVFALAIVTSLMACKKEGSSSSQNSSSTQDENVEPLASKTEIEKASYAFGVSLGQQAERYNENPQLKDSLDPVAVEKGINDYFKDPKEMDSYNYGLNTGKQISTALDNGILKGNLDKDQIMAGMLDYMKKKQLKVTKDSVNAVMQSFYTNLQAKALEKNEKVGSAFMEKVTQEDGVVNTGKGIAYRVIKEGTGEKPKMGDKVKVLYTGKTISGNEFDSTKDGDPREFVLRPGGLIKGWLEAMTLMPKGSKYEFYIPDSLAYGEQGSRDGKIAPGETLIFDIELVDFSEGQPTPEMPQPGVQIQPK